MKHFKFSIIMAVYNVEKYLEEAIESVINQTLGFKDNVEIILVDDGSTDNSAIICKRYVKKYSENIKYIYKENGGPSSARNSGIKVATGEYYNFLDSDDLLHEAALEKVYNFFDIYKEVDMVTLPIECIERQQGLYHRYKKFGKESKVIDLNVSPKDYVFSSAATFYRSKIFENTEFNTNLKLAEDLFFNTKLYLKNNKFGFISPNEAIYYYRKRFSNNSITNINEYTDNWLTNTLEYIYKELLQESRKVHKVMPDFLQYIFVYNIVKRLENPNSISKKTFEKFTEISESILSHVDENIIMTYNYTNYQMLVMMLMFKNKEYNIENLFDMDNKNNICINGKIIENVANYSFKISSLEIIDNKLRIIGYFNDLIVDEFKIMCNTHDNQEIINELKIELTSETLLSNRFFDTVMGKTYCVTGEIPITEKEITYNIELYVKNSVIPLQLKNISEDKSIEIGKLYNTKYGKCKIKLNNELINISY